MNRAEAIQLLQEGVSRARSRSYEELCGLMGNPEHRQATGGSGVTYQVETQVFWDDRPGGNLRVLVAIDDGGLRAFAPLSDDFIMSSDGGFAGE